MIGRLISRRRRHNLRSLAARLCEVFGYPFITSLAITAFSFMQGGGLPLSLCTYGALVLATLLIIANEYHFPYRASWTPRSDQVLNDAIFLSVVNILWPKALAFAGMLAALELHRASGWFDLKIWPTHLALGVQVLLLLIVGDFGRYWTHRACHTIPVLWRLHAVHHSPHGLYTLNAGRLHPLEVSLHFLVDVLPFLLLGVPKKALAIYFLLYAINGFYKHANCHVRLGFLNLVMSGPELHRWHHSRCIEESSANYGTTLIIWDRLFRTYYDPKDRSVGKLGLADLNYPTGFVGQLFAPFRVTTAASQRP